MNPADLDAAISSQTFAADLLRKTLAVAGPVEALILLPLIAQAQGVVNTLVALKSALRESAQ